MNQEDSLRREIHQTLDAIGGPTPELLPRITDRLHPVSRRRPFLAIGQVAAVLGIGLVVGAVVFAMHLSRVNPATVTTAPTGPIIAGPGANIAWVTSETADLGYVVSGIDPAGHVVGRINAPIELRSPDGAHLYAIGDSTIDVYSAADGHREQTVRLQSVSGSAHLPMLSANGRYLAVVGGSPATLSTVPWPLELVDLSTGRSVASITVGSPADGVPVIVGAQAQHVYVIGGTAIVKLAFDGTTLRVEQRSNTPPCSGLSVGGGNSAGGLPFRVLADARTLVAFCPLDGRIAWYDLGQMMVRHEVVVSQRNPFWNSPVFSPDGNTLYLHEGGTGALHVVDLVSQTVVGSTKVATADRNPLAWLGSLLVTPVDAGGIPRTAAVSPDGNWLYAVGAFGAPPGVSIVHLPDLRVRARWISDVSLDSVWASADGQTIYVLTQSGDSLRILRPDGSQIGTLTLPANPYGFIVPTIP